MPGAWGRSAGCSASRGGSMPTPLPAAPSGSAAPCSRRSAPGRERAAGRLGCAAGGDRAEGRAPRLAHLEHARVPRGRRPRDRRDLGGPAQSVRASRPGRARASHGGGRARLSDGPRRGGHLRDRRTHAPRHALGGASDRALLPRPRGDLLESSAMARVNDHYLKLRSSYLFSEIARRVREFQDAHPGARLIRLGIGDVTRPLAPAVITALHSAVDEMARAETFKGYGPETGY